jgi:pyridoxamine 5'-phosphate oxidase
MREHYIKGILIEENMPNNPIDLFKEWLAVVIAEKLPEPNAMFLATANAQGKPSVRTVLLKGLDGRGFIFYTNYESQKGQDLAENPQASLLFCWLPLERQVRIEGKVIKLPATESEAYFHTRPKDSQIGATISPQSRVIPDRKGLEEKVVAYQQKYSDTDTLPLPDYWGGYILIPDSIEFWQGRANRLHDRLLYQRTDISWRLERLAP